MSDLKELLHGAGEAKRQRFADEDFAAGYGRAIVSRVKRRRVASASAVGGGTLVAAGAIAVGASNLPWSGVGFGLPGASSNVVCTTSSPIAPTPSADNVLSAGGSPSPSNLAIWGIAVGSEDPPNIVANVVLNVQTNEVTASNPGGDSLVLTRDAEGVYTAQLDEGHMFRFAMTDGSLVLKSPTLEPVGEPVVSCVATAPSPSASSSPRTSPAISAQPGASPNPAMSDSFGAVGSPFQCGFEFDATARESDDLQIVGDATTESEIRTTLLDWYGEQAPATQVGDTDAPAYRASVEYDITGFAGGFLDPMRVTEFDKSIGITFVAVRDGVGIGTVETESDGATYGMVNDADDNPGPVQAFMWDRSAISPCGTTSVDDADIYAVVGVKTGEAVEYAWARVRQQQ